MSIPDDPELRAALRELANGFYVDGDSYEWGIREGYTLKDLKMEKANELITAIDLTIPRPD